MFALFLTSEISPLHVGWKRFTKTFNGDFPSFLLPEKVWKVDSFVDTVVLFLNMQVQSPDIYSKWSYKVPK